MTTLLAHFDGQVLVPDEPVNLPQNRTLRIQIEEEPMAPAPLRALYNAFKDLPDDPQSPRDGAAQHDHYLYGTPKRDNP
ncbi:hypothetical protein B1R32_1033 [Abditibacterium utsteinense]|uniref:DUF104 domain-containing protein n=1 Tax=Abditibacterium utsteinense TaxID=1960156 RepID=A0A2S8SVB9_9BACT|nr:hypothetical protein [Abditibacterium utsteinense]PQV64736.1 hypothetical protein B1R32_1033 [Abditibacterium utsteinense]